MANKTKKAAPTKKAVKKAPAKNQVKKLSPQQQKFVEEYLVDLNGTQAAIRAGYSAKTARSKAAQLLTIVNIKEAVDKLKLKRSVKTGITAEFVLEAASKLYVRCMGDEAMLDDEGVQKFDDDGEGYVYPFNAAGAGKAIELMGKHVNVQAWKDNLEVKVVDTADMLTNRIGVAERILAERNAG